MERVAVFGSRVLTKSTAHAIAFRALSSSAGLNAKKFNNEPKKFNNEPKKFNNNNKNKNTPNNKQSFSFGKQTVSNEKLEPFVVPGPSWVPADPIWFNHWDEEKIAAQDPTSMLQRLKKTEDYPMLDYNEYCKVLKAAGSFDFLTKEQFEVEKTKILHLLNTFVEEDVMEEQDFFVPDEEEEESVILGKSWEGDHPMAKEDGFRGSRGKETPIETVILKTWRTTNMKRSGRTRTMNCLAISGNLQGGAGFAVAKSVEAADAQEKAVKRAANAMIPISIKDNHTIFKDTNAQFITTQVYMQHAPRGHGLVCHRNIFEICKLVGIKDLIANVKGSTNPINVVKATFACLQSQVDDRQAQADHCHQILLEYVAPHMMPKIVCRPSKHSKAQQRKGVTSSLNPRDSEKLMTEWFNKFPMSPSEESFAMARLMRHGLFVAETCKERGKLLPAGFTSGLELALSSRGDVVKWLRSKPANLDLSYSRMYALDEETLENHKRFEEFDDIDDDGVLFFEDLTQALKPKKKRKNFL